jgi:hypothetical protein
LQLTKDLKLIARPQNITCNINKIVVEITFCIGLCTSNGRATGSKLINPTVWFTVFGGCKENIS